MESLERGAHRGKNYLKDSPWREQGEAGAREGGTISAENWVAGAGELGCRAVMLPGMLGLLGKMGLLGCWGWGHG